MFPPQRAVRRFLTWAGDGSGAYWPRHSRRNAQYASPSIACDHDDDPLANAPPSKGPSVIPALDVFAGPLATATPSSQRRIPGLRSSTVARLPLRASAARAQIAYVLDSTGRSRARGDRTRTRRARLLSWDGCDPAPPAAPAGTYAEARSRSRPLRPYGDAALIPVSIETTKPRRTLLRQTSARLRRYSPSCSWLGDGSPFRQRAFEHGSAKNVPIVETVRVRARRRRRWRRPSDARCRRETGDVPSWRMMLPAPRKADAGDDAVRCASHRGCDHRTTVRVRRREAEQSKPGHTGACVRAARRACAHLPFPPDRRAEQGEIDIGMRSFSVFHDAPRGCPATHWLLPLSWRGACRERQSFVHVSYRSRRGCRKQPISRNAGLVSDGFMPRTMLHRHFDRSERAVGGDRRLKLDRLGSRSACGDAVLRPMAAAGRPLTGGTSSGTRGQDR